MDILQHLSDGEKPDQRGQQPDAGDQGGAPAGDAQRPDHRIRPPVARNSPGSPAIRPAAAPRSVGV
ncbi:hypothetical protein, partial [Mangrovicoccus algicola]|uniref:hypothetical protein n=1 Tax=Mangrovicoccus algicola TaxID=2771008 RepID=UPI001D0116BB